jgi:hypothetical protein
MDELTELRRWKEAAEIVLAEVRVNDQPALVFIDAVVRTFSPSVEPIEYNSSTTVADDGLK